MYWVVLHFHPTFSSTSRGFEHCSIGGRISWGATPIAPQGKKTAGLVKSHGNFWDPSPWSDHTLGVLNRNVLWSFTRTIWKPHEITVHLGHVREHCALAARWEMYSWCLAVDPDSPRNGHRNRSERRTSQKAIVSGISKMKYLPFLATNRV